MSVSLAYAMQVTVSFCAFASSTMSSYASGFARNHLTVLLHFLTIGSINSCIFTCSGSRILFLEEDALTVSDASTTSFSALLLVLELELLLLLELLSGASAGAGTAVASSSSVAAGTTAPLPDASVVLAAANDECVEIGAAAGTAAGTAGRAGFRFRVLSGGSACLGPN